MRITHLPLGIPAGFDRIKKILTNEICVFTSSLLSFFPDKASLTLQSLPVELDKLRSPVISDEAVSMDSKTINMAE